MTVERGTWIFVVLVGLATLWLAWLNRGSEKVSVNLPVAAAVGVVGALLTLLFSLQSEEKQAAFPVEYVLQLDVPKDFQSTDPATKETRHFQTNVPFPVSCEAFPECEQYTDAGGLTNFRASFIVPEFVRNGIAAPTSDAGIGRLYRDVLFRQILDILRFTYLKSWNAEPSHFELPTGGSKTEYAAREMRVGRKLTNRELVDLFTGDVTVESPSLTHLNLPPNTDVSGEKTASESFLRLQNKFANVVIKITDMGVEGGAGGFRELCRLPLSEPDPFRRPRYLVTVSAKFSRYRSGHHEMSLYRHWVDTMIGEIRRFDSLERWDRVRDTYLLLYAHRTKTPLQELMDYTLKKAEPKKADETK